MATVKHKRDKWAIAFGKAVSRGREARGWTQTELAEKAGLCVSVMNRIERGRSVPRLGNLQAIVLVLGAEFYDGRLRKFFFRKT